MKLNVQERIALQIIFPASGSVNDIENRISILKKLTFSDEEIEKFNIKKSETEISYDDPENTYSDFDFTEEEMSYMEKIAVSCNESGSVQDFSLSAVKKLIKEGE